MKDMFFLSGLPRTGSSVLSALLNQNPDIYCSHYTNLLPSMVNYQKQINTYESVSAGINVNGYYQVLQNMGTSFYAHIDKPYVIDKSRGWGSLESLPFANFLSRNIKIIFPVRPILEILASFISVVENNENNFIDYSIRELNYPVYRPVNDVRCDYLMSHIGPIGLHMPIFEFALRPENKEKFFFFDYNYLLSSPEDMLGELYAFLGIDSYKHNFESIVEGDLSNDLQAFGVSDLHTVRPLLQKTSKPYEEVLSKYVINKYKNALDFTGLFS
jgi:sulfotransferase